MNIQKRHIFLATLVLISAGFLNIRQKSLTSDIQNAKVIQTFEATMSIKKPEGNTDYNITQYVGKTVLFTTNAVTEGNIKSVGKDKGTIITSIAGLEVNTKKNEYWALSINGNEVATEAAVSLVPNHSKLVWELKTK